MFTCPCCQSKLDFEPGQETAKGWVGSQEICPHCGIQFGYTDSAGGSEKKRQQIYRLWRAKWQASGRKPLSPADKREVITKAMRS